MTQTQKTREAWVTTQFVTLHLGSDRMGVTEGDLQVYRCRRDPGKLSNNFCYTYLTKDQHPPSN